MSAIAALLTLTISTPALAAEPLDVCTREAVRLAPAYGVPPALAAAIIRAESSGSPYAIGQGLAPSRARTLMDAEQVVATALYTGRCIDIGCMQINSCAHGKRVNDITALLDPVSNVKVGLGYLRELFDRTGDWVTAAGNFHSHTPVYNQVYRCRLALVFDPSYRSERCDLAQQLAGQLRANRRPNPSDPGQTPSPAAAGGL